MNKALRQLHVTASDIGLCLLCGGENGNCSCAAPVDRALPNYERWAVVDLRDSGWAVQVGPRRPLVNLLCFRSRHIVAVEFDRLVVRCVCGNLLRYEHKPVIPEPDYSLIEVSQPPRRALRKPKI